MKTELVLLTVCCLLAAVSAQSWVGPYQLSSDTFSDINPSGCKEFLPVDVTVLVWQSNRNGNWDVYSRFDSVSDGNRWGPEKAVSLDSADDVNPVVACMNDWRENPSYWCVWERRESQLIGSIWASYVTFPYNWGEPVRLGRTIHTDGDSAQPSIIVTGGMAMAVWRNHDTSGTYINYACNYDGLFWWTGPEVAVTGDVRHARLGRLRGGHPNDVPLLVWEQAGDIFYSTYTDPVWTSPEQVAPSAFEDRNPDVVSDDRDDWCGTYVVWESMRDGDTAIYITDRSSFSIGQRVCNASGAGRSFSPAGADVAFTGLDDWRCIVGFVSDRNGNPDIYSNFWYSGDDWVDLDSANDLAPVVTCVGNGSGKQMAWVLWQSDRTCNWDIFGSFMYNSGVQETPNAEVRTTAAATVVRRLPSGAVVFDATGRRVVNPRPGVYFVRSEPSAAGREPSAFAVRKVVVQR